HVLQAPDPPWLEMLRIPLQMAMVATFLAALVLLLPIIAYSLQFLLRTCRFTNRAVWPPTFSTAVLAMGALGTGQTLQLDSITTLGTIAAWATLMLWAITGCWNLHLDLRCRLHPDAGA